MKVLPRVGIHVLHSYTLVMMWVVEGGVRQRGVAVPVPVGQGGVAVHAEGVCVMTRTVVAQLMLRVLVSGPNLATHARMGVPVVPRRRPAPRGPAHRGHGRCVRVHGRKLRVLVN